MTSAISVDDVHFAYDDEPVLRGVSLSVEQGAFLGVLGPNGSGKTTLVRIMLGLERPDAGRVELFGQPAETFTDGTRLGYVSQHSTDADATMPVTVREVVTMGRYAHAGIDRLNDADHAAVDDALERVDITDIAGRRLSTLSGGQRQRAYIARALASEADLLALDEPTVGIDADSLARFYDLLGELNDEGITIVLVEHDIGVVTEHASTIACLDGELYAHCETSAFLESDALERAFSSVRVANAHRPVGGD
ncbi:metal ABC transporter ATP-binding protein [Natronobiforma cellulositropha]|uniref:metal ABC transporter ATP-binding protein n=1 Tax=Natronobiforma cellulositropha TaxID=1679076 RepID=UPI0021D59625|nr:metal ABC transporter ATP-binding protein [Natronobiforma cellulositropha]